MKQIKNFVKNTFKDIDKDKKEEIISSVTESLLEKVEDLIESGLTEQDAINKAVVEFGTLEDYFDETGKRFKTILRYWSDQSDMKYKTYLLPEFTSLRENHSSSLPIEDVKFDQGLKENFFSERVLMRSKW